ncbi:hypothetical protein D9M68_667040 [compost metagenome]
MAPFRPIPTRWKATASATRRCPTGWNPSAISPRCSMTRTPWPRPSPATGPTRCSATCWSPPATPSWSTTAPAASVPKWWPTAWASAPCTTACPAPTRSSSSAPIPWATSPCRWMCRPTSAWRASSPARCRRKAAPGSRPAWPCSRPSRPTSPTATSAMRCASAIPITATSSTCSTCTATSGCSTPMTTTPTTWTPRA